MGSHGTYHGITVRPTGSHGTPTGYHEGKHKTHDQAFRIWHTVSYAWNEASDWLLWVSAHALRWDAH